MCISTNKLITASSLRHVQRDLVIVFPNPSNGERGHQKCPINGYLGLLFKSGLVGHKELFSLLFQFLFNTS